MTVRKTFGIKTFRYKNVRNNEPLEHWSVPEQTTQRKGRCHVIDSEAYHATDAYQSTVITLIFSTYITPWPNPTRKWLQESMSCRNSMVQLDTAASSRRCFGVSVSIMHNPRKIFNRGAQTSEQTKCLREAFTGVQGLATWRGLQGVCAGC